MNYKAIIFSLLSFCTLIACNAVKQTEEILEDVEAKKLLQGIWLSEEGNTNLRIAGDSIFYSESNMLPVSFAIYDDTLVIHSIESARRYAVLECSAKAFSFKNAAGDVMSYSKSDSEEDSLLFEESEDLGINQCQLIKRDTIVTVNNHKYHAYIQINPSSYKVVNTTFTSDGLQVDNVYYDNIINICLYDGGKRLFSRDFKKQDFQKLVPEEYLSNSILSDIYVSDITEGRAIFKAYICVPNSQTSYIVKLKDDDAGKYTIEI